VCYISVWQSVAARYFIIDLFSPYYTAFLNLFNNNNIACHCYIGVSREIENLIQENSELLATKYATFSSFFCMSYLIYMLYIFSNDPVYVILRYTDL